MNIFFREMRIKTIDRFCRKGGERHHLFLYAYCQTQQ